MQPAAYPGAHPPEISGVSAQSGFQVRVPRVLIDVHAHPGTLGLCTQGAGPLIRMRTHPGFQLWAPSPLIWVLPAGLQVCLSYVHSPGAERGETQEAMTAAESSLTSC